MVDYNALKQNNSLIAIACGPPFHYKIDKKRSSVNSTFLWHEVTNSKLIVKRGQGVDVYFDINDDQNNGSVIDFIHFNAEAMGLPSDTSLYQATKHWIQHYSQHSALHYQVLPSTNRSMNFKPIESRELISHHITAYGKRYNLPIHDLIEEGRVEDEFHSSSSQLYIPLSSFDGQFLLKGQQNILTKRILKNSKGFQFYITSKNLLQSPCHLIITESFKDSIAALCHFQSNWPVVSMATIGSLTTKKIQGIQEVRKVYKRNIKRITLAFDNDFIGLKYTIQFLNSCRESPYPVIFDRVSKVITVNHIHIESRNGRKIVMNKLQSLFQRTLSSNKLHIYIPRNDDVYDDYS